MNDPEDECLLRPQIFHHRQADAKRWHQRPRPACAIRPRMTCINITAAYPLLVQPRSIDQQLCVWRVASIGFPRHALKRRAVVLDAHQLASALVALLPMAIRSLELGSRRNRATSKAVAGIPRHNRLRCEHIGNIALNSRYWKRHKRQALESRRSRLNGGNEAQSFPTAANQTYPWQCCHSRGSGPI